MRAGDDVSIWSNSVVDYGCVIGDRVKIHCNCYVAQYTELEDDVFLAPGVTIANDLYPGTEASAEAMAGPLVREGAQIGVNATLLPYVTIGRGAIVGAGSVVTRDVPDGMIAYGNPAIAVRPVPDARSVATRIGRARSRDDSSVPTVAGDAVSVSTGRAESSRRARFGAPLIGTASPNGHSTWCSEPSCASSHGRSVAVAAVAVAIESGGPVFFRQERVGRRRPDSSRCGSCGRWSPATTTRCIANTSGRCCANGECSLEAGASGLHKLDDRRIALASARILRRTSMNELPQLFNVLSGEMSLVGPRPSLPWEVELYTPEQRMRHACLPGLTGLWQVSGRNRLPMPVRSSSTARTRCTEACARISRSSSRRFPAVLERDAA